MLRYAYILIIAAVLGACHINTEQKRALADVQAAEISYIYDKRTGLCFTASKINSDMYAYSYIPCELVPKILIPNYPTKLPKKEQDNSCRFNAVITSKNTSLI